VHLPNRKPTESEPKMSPHLYADLMNSNSLELGRAAARGRRQATAPSRRGPRAQRAGRFQIGFPRVAARHS
jgi:hypothetical protein